MSGCACKCVTVSVVVSNTGHCIVELTKLANRQFSFFTFFSFKLNLQFLAIISFRIYVFFGDYPHSAQIVSVFFTLNKLTHTQSISKNDLIFFRFLFLTIQSDLFGESTPTERNIGKIGSSGRMCRRLIAALLRDYVCMYIIE